MSWGADDLVRRLAPSEERFVGSGLFGWWTMVVAGELAPAVLSAAFTTLQRVYPVLTCRIVEDARGRGLLVKRAAGPRVGAWVRTGDVDTVADPAGPTDPAAQLAYLDVVLAEGRSRVTLFVHHAVADARHLMELYGRLWDFYTDPAAAAKTGDGRDYPQSLEWHVATHGIERGPISGLAAVLRPFDATPEIPSGPPLGGVLVRPARLRLDDDLTASISALSRRYGLTINSVVTAVLMRAWAVRTPEFAGGPVPVGALYAVDLRDRLDPPVPVAAGTTMATTACFAAEIDGRTDVLELAHRISGRFRDELAAGIIHQSVLHFPDVYGAEREHGLAGHLSLTNLGVINTPAALDVLDFETGFQLAHPRLSAADSPAALLMFYTFGGRITIGHLGGGADENPLLASVRREIAALAPAGRAELVR
ncbi:acyltransferase [Nocardia sp. NPDC052566]|uniref:phthiocerol/phthiodiolone dimycocerosyl transferase family protein n=1 Tax=Nocardia sp. NPDC052566 TaxID=3364330 RepID=UPI0037CA1332